MNDYEALIALGYKVVLFCDVVWVRVMLFHAGYAVFETTRGTLAEALAEALAWHNR